MTTEGKEQGGNFWYVIIGAIIVFALFKQCENEPKVITKTETKVIRVTDTITKVQIKEVPKTVYLQKTKDSIIFVPNPTKTSIKANQFTTNLESNSANAKLQITTTGELLDVSGIITYPKETKTVTITKIKDKGGFYIYGQLPINNISSPELGVLWQIRNKMFVSGGASLNNLTKNIDFNIGLGVKL